MGPNSSQLEGGIEHPRNSQSVQDEVEVEIEVKEPISRRAHHAVEKRYRTNLNEKIATLDRLISKNFKGPLPEAIQEKQENNEGTSEVSGASTKIPGTRKVHRQNKTAVLSKAIQYIQDLEKDYSSLREHIEALRVRASVAMEVTRG